LLTFSTAETMPAVSVKAISSYASGEVLDWNAPARPLP
jgi:hypothetical protein